jgi:hypothetical protein
MILSRSKGARLIFCGSTVQGYSQYTALPRRGVAARGNFDVALSFATNLIVVMGHGKLTES